MGEREVIGQGVATSAVISERRLGDKVLYIYAAALLIYCSL